MNYFERERRLKELYEKDLQDTLMCPLLLDDFFELRDDCKSCGSYRFCTQVKEEENEK